VVISFGDGWRFGPAAEGSSLPGFDDSGFEAVTLPHTVAPLSWQGWDPAAWERVWAYRKHFDALDAWDVAGRRAADVMSLTVEAIASQRVTPEGQEGLRAFLEKRPAAWTSGAPKPR